MPWHTLIEHDGEPIQGRFPVLGRHRPFLADVAQSQIIQLDECIVVGNEPLLLVTLRKLI